MTGRVQRLSHPARHELLPCTCALVARPLWLRAASSALVFLRRVWGKKMHTASHSYQQLHTLIMRGPHFACSLCLYTRAKIMCDSSAVTAVERAVAARTPSAAARSQRRRRASARACRPAAARSVAQQRCCLSSHPRSKKRSGKMAAFSAPVDGRAPAGSSRSLPRSKAL